MKVKELTKKQKIRVVNMTIKDIEILINNNGYDPLCFLIVDNICNVLRLKDRIKLDVIELCIPEFIQLRKKHNPNNQTFWWHHIPSIPIKMQKRLEAAKDLLKLIENKEI